MKPLIHFLLLLPFFLSAQPNQQWYDENDRGIHYEGSYTRKVSNPSINLVSLTGSLPAYQFGKKQKMHIRFFSPEMLKYNLHAEELRISQFYWLEDKSQNTKQGWNTFNNWQVDYLLKRFSIDHRNLGVLIRLGGKGERQYLPAFVQLGEEVIPPQRYIAQVRLGRPSSGGSFSLFKSKSRTKNHLIKIQSISRKSSGTVFPIVIPNSELDNQNGWYTIEINMKEEQTGDPFTYSFAFYHTVKD